MNSDLVSSASRNASGTTVTMTDKSQGYLEITILSAYDLIARDPPKAVEISVAGHCVLSGPPVQRHKDRNSFRFAPTGSSTASSGTNGNSSAAAKSHREIVAPLADLYPATVTFRILYEDDPNNDSNKDGDDDDANQESSSPLQATYTLSHLHIHETRWLVLNLETGMESSNAPNTSMETSTLASDDTFRVAPTLRLKLTLHGPYRTEIATAMNLCTAWFRLVDQLEASGAVILQKLPDPKWFLVPLAPILAMAVVSTPVVAGVLVVALPMVLPILVVLSFLGTVVVGSGIFLYASTKQGRQEWLQPLLGPAASTLLSTPTGQQMVYRTGPRPTPVHLCRIILPQESLWGRLLVSLWVDLIGSSSYLLPLVGEAFDLVWAPVQTILIMALYDDITPALKYLSFVEEILPFTDIVPSATIGWLAEFGVPWAQQRLGWSTSTSNKSSSSDPLLQVMVPSTPFSSPNNQ